MLSLLRAGFLKGAVHCILLLKMLKVLKVEDAGGLLGARGLLGAEGVGGGGTTSGGGAIHLCHGFASVSSTFRGHQFGVLTNGGIGHCRGAFIECLIFHISE